MKLNRMKCIFLSAVFAVSVLSPLASAQTKEPSPNDTLVSPEVSSDHRVTFRIYAPKATEVIVSGDWPAEGWGPGEKLTRDDRGVWSVTIGPLKPDIYCYLFTVDGVRTLDPKNGLVKQGTNSAESLAEVTGEEYEFQAIKAVPHGEVRRVWYQSPSYNVMRSFHIYTPPGYEAGREKYPVLYLLHGGGDDDTGWATFGRAGIILDNLLAAKKAKPMIIVMPNGSMPRGISGDPTELFSRDLLGTIMPMVEKNYRVIATRENRAIAGLSMGGWQTLAIAPSNIDRFAYVGAWSVGVRQPDEDSYQKRHAKFFEAPEKTNQMVKLFSIVSGEKDQLAIAGAGNLSSLFKKHGIKHEYHVSPGGHTWVNWRQYLRDFAPLLFR